MSSDLKNMTYDKPKTSPLHKTFIVGLILLVVLVVIFVVALLAVVTQHNIKEKIISSGKHHTKDEYTGAEDDNKERKAEVYMNTTAISSSGIQNAVGTALKHWIIVARFEDGLCITLDGNRDKSDGRIYGHYKKETPIGVQHEEKLGDVMTSPRKLWDIVRNNEINNTPYNAGNNNCQHWALKAARHIGLHIEEALKKVQSYKEGELGIITLGSALLGFGFSSSRSSR